MTAWQKWVGQNPLFHYHLLGQARWLLRRPLHQLLLIALPMVIIYFWLLSKASQESVHALAVSLECVVVWLLAPLMTHSLFAAEFEKATWDMLVITRLSASQIVMGKFLPQLVLLAMLLLPFQPLLLLSLLQEHKGLSGFWELFKAQWVIVSWAVLLIAATLWLSFRLRRGMTTAAVAFVGQIFVLFILPTLWLIFTALFFGEEIVQGVVEFGEEKWTVWGWMVDLRYAVWFYNPIIALAGVYALAETTNLQSAWLWGLWQGFVYLLLAGGFIAVLIRTVAKATRKPI